MDDLKQKIKILAVKFTVLLFKGLILIKKALTSFFIAVKLFFNFLFRIFLFIGGKKFILAVYKMHLNIRRAITKIFLPSKNKFLYPFINKETTNAIIIIITILICAENIKLRITRAQNTEELLGNDSILAGFATEELEDSMLIEEEATINDDNIKFQQNEYPADYAVKNSQIIGTSTNEIEEEFNAQILANSEALLKPDMPSTEETPQARQGAVEYIVEAGDVLGAIADKFNISINTILWANNLGYTSRIRPGDKLKILPVSGVFHIVSSGENLGGIAKKYNVDAAKILEFNKLSNGDSIKKGQELIIPGGVIKQTAPSRTVLVNNAAPAASPYSIVNIFAPSKEQYSRSSKFLWPTTSKRITQYYHLGHHAIDIGAPKGTPIYAIEKGRVILSGWSSGYGYNIIVDHGNGQKSRYAHFSKLYVKSGAVVTKGQQIGEMGSTGNSTGSHLHIEIIISGVKVNPLKYIQ
ncbi:MAG: peptidoglycan DD-metalloendopeptidase family protein [bacterium]